MKKRTGGNGLSEKRLLWWRNVAWVDDIAGALSGIEINPSSKGLFCAIASDTWVTTACHDFENPGPATFRKPLTRNLGSGAAAFLRP